METLKAIAVATLKTVFAYDSPTALHRSAVFLTTFLVIHLAGNLFVFAGGDWFNWYGHKLRSNPLISFIEYYLLAGGLVHAAAAMQRSYIKRRQIAKKPMR